MTSVFSGALAEASNHSPLVRQLFMRLCQGNQSMATATYAAFQFLLTVQPNVQHLTFNFLGNAAKRKHVQ
jgi:hypothetical protein